MDDEVLIGGKEKRDIVLVEHDAAWAGQFLRHRKIIEGSLGDLVIEINHIGSTSVPGLAAKAIVDMDLVVRDSSDEDLYLEKLVEAGYVLRVREPDWHEHRMFRTAELDVHLHVFSEGCDEVKRHLAFRDHLRVNEVDRKLYEDTKRRLAKHDWSDMNAYAEAKGEVVEGILLRAMDGES